MKQVTKLLINDFKIKQLGFDFMGYKIQKNETLSFHHLIIPNRNNGAMEYWNGAILSSDTSHPYLHLIESIDYDIFSYITSEMIDMKIKGYLDLDNIRQIYTLLEYFEKEHQNKKNTKGKYLIKEKYKEINRIRL